MSTNIQKIEVIDDFDKELKPRNKQQETLFASGGETKEILFGGAAGGSKTFSIVVDPIMKKCHEISGFQGAIYRRTYPQIRESIEVESNKWYPKFGYKYNATDHVWIKKRNGRVHSKIMFIHAELEKDVFAHDSAAYDYLAFDELTQFTEFMYRYLYHRNRPNIANWKPYIRAGATPGDIGNCIPDGEVLTPSGWKDIKSFKIGDPIYEVDMDGNLIESNVKAVVKEHFKGNLINIVTQNLHIRCTPNHKLMHQIRPRTKSSYNRLEQCQDLPRQARLRRTVTPSLDNTSKEFFDLGVTPNIQPRYILWHNFVELFGWYISEGNYCDYNNYRGFAIAQQKLDTKLDIQVLLQSCGFRYHYDGKQFMIYDKYWMEYFKQFGKSRDKYIPREILDSSDYTHLNIIFIAMMKGDGHWQTDNAGNYYTFSKQLADDFAEIAVKLGCKVRICNRNRDTDVEYRVDFAFNSDYTDVEKDKHFYDEPFDGTVYCVEVPMHHTFICKQNGSVFISGNTWVRDRFVVPGGIQGYKRIKVRQSDGEYIWRMFIPSFAADNPVLMARDPGYLTTLQVLPEALKKAKLYGDWWAFQGQVFTEFRAYHYPDEPENALHVIPAFNVPKSWPKIIAIDPGYRHNTWVGFGAIHPITKQLIIYREYMCKETDIKIWAADIRRISQDDGYFYGKICDTSAWDEEGLGTSIIEQIQRATGWKFTQANKDRIGGKLLLHELFRWKPMPMRFNVKMEEFDMEYALKLQRIKGKEAYNLYVNQFIPDDTSEVLPKMLIFDTCPQLINTIQSVVYDDKKIEDVKKQDGDDPYDGVRYLAQEYIRIVKGELPIQLSRELEIEKIRLELEKSGDWNAFYHQMRILDEKSKVAFKPFSTVNFKKHDRVVIH